MVTGLSNPRLPLTPGGAAQWLDRVFSWLCKPQGARPNQQFLALVLRLGLDLELDFRN